ncbi:methyltransferase domain-containing protein [candidate division KSB1 bacterium]|nr:methyltransferase domain-containing protein [candidate division KSB1 bacterium]
MFTPSRRIKSNQTCIHPELEHILYKHKNTPFCKPLSAHTLAAFDQVNSVVKNSKLPVILDSGCGTGVSSFHLSLRHPEQLVIGIDKSAHRLNKFHAHFSQKPKNLLLVRADLIDFWRLAFQNGWSVNKNYILYPNPWPKKRDIKKRFHGHPVFFELLNLSTKLELTSNWEIYVLEFAYAVKFVTGRICQIEKFIPQYPISPFEKKYKQSGHFLYRLLYSVDSL